MPHSVDSLVLLGTVVDDAPIGFAVFDRDLRFVYINRSLAAVNGLSVEDHLGRRMTELFEPAIAVPLEEPVERVIRTGEPDHDVVDTLDVPGGSRRFLINRYPIRNAMGHVVAAAVSVNDITERHRLAEVEREAARLRETAELAHQLDAAQRIAGIGSWEYNLVTGAVSWSAQMRALLGLHEAPRDYKSVRKLVHPDDRALADQYLRRLAQTGAPHMIEWRMVRADGGVITVVTNGEPIRDEAGRVVKILGTTHDLTRQRAVEADAHRARLEATRAQTQMESEREVLRLFQRAMLPNQLPDMEGAELAVAYRPLSPEMDIGGDWYDAFTLPDGRVVLSIGDIAGHDLQAAAVVGQVRSAIRAYAMLDPAPGLVLERSNTLLRQRPDVVLVSMLYGVYDPANRRLTWGSAGHPPPVLRRSDAVMVLRRPQLPMLGAVSRGEPYSEQCLELGPDDALVWYTDGLVERRNGDLGRAIDHLAAMVAGAGDMSAQELATYLLDECLRDIQQSDDVCLLVLQQLPSGDVRPA
ncbi:MAG TPA: SpoIIE family protein phosphatase [Micromonosporaceae bacterium]